MLRLRVSSSSIVSARIGLAAAGFLAAAVLAAAGFFAAEVLAEAGFFAAPVLAAAGFFAPAALFVPAAFFVVDADFFFGAAATAFTPVVGERADGSVRVGARRAKSSAEGPGRTHVPKDR
jgi:hypothetical protein